MKHQSSGAGKRCLWGVLALLLRAMSTVRAGDELTAEQALERNRQAMRPPVSYRLRANGIESFVKSGEVGGSPVTRIETQHPVPKVTVIVGDEVHEYFPNQKLIMDMSHIRGGLRAATGAAASQNVPASEMSGTASALKRERRNGVECVLVTQELSPTVLDAAKSAIGGNGLPIASVPASKVSVFDAASFETIAELLLSPEGSVLLSTEYLDVTHAAIPDSEFLLPDNFKLLKPQSVTEYFQLLMDEVVPKPTRGNEELARMTEVYKQAALDLANEARAKADPEEFRSVQASQPAALLIPGRRSSVSIAVVVSTLLILTFVSMLFVRRRWSRRHNQLDA